MKNKKNPIIIPSDILEELEKVPSNKKGCSLIKWKDWEDKILLEYWKTKNKEKLSKLIGHCLSSCRNRFRELNESTDS